MPLMFDSVDLSKVPRDATLVAGYIDGRYKTTPEQWALFPHARHLLIATSWQTNDGRVIDVENGDATQDQAVQWVKMRRASTAHPLGGPATVYTSLDNWRNVLAAFVHVHIDPPQFWVADWTGHDHIPPGAVACQWQSTPGYDLSTTMDEWP